MGTYAAQIEAGADKLGMKLSAAQVDQLERHAALLLKWNAKINLTAITDPAEVIEKHLLDSLAIAPHLPAGRLLDAGTGAGFPGIPVRIVRPDIEVWLVDSVQKKVAFLKSALVELKLTGIRAQALRLSGKPKEEGLPLFDAAIARAFAAPVDWLPLAQQYLAAQGRAFCLLGARDEAPDRSGRLARISTFEFVLPTSKAPRKLVEYSRGE
jgi:16S rRNA (guanine527-N7)-methyltransferase